MVVALQFTATIHITQANHWKTLSMKATKVRMCSLLRHRMRPLQYGHGKLYCHGKIHAPKVSFYPCLRTFFSLSCTWKALNTAENKRCPGLCFLRGGNGYEGLKAWLRQSFHPSAFFICLILGYRSVCSVIKPHRNPNLSINVTVHELYAVLCIG